MAISNIYTLSESVQISAETKEIAFTNLEIWKELVDKGESFEVVKNLVYSSLILFYNIVLKKKDREVKSYEIQ